jgi:hypothetical protein
VGSEGITRRTLLGRGLAAGSALAVTGVPGSALAARRRARWTFADPRRLRREVTEMVELGPRLTATSPHLQFIDALDDGFRAAGCTVTRDPHPFDQWVAQRSALDVLAGPEAGAVPVASEYTYSGKTGPQGVTGQLAYLGPLPADATALSALLGAVPGGLAGRIVLMDAPIAPLKVGALDPLLTYRHDPDGSISETDDYTRAWTTLATIPRLDAFKAAGAAGVVFALGASAENAAGQYAPFIWGYADLPALIVDRDTGARLRRAAAGAAKARLVLEATLQRTSSDSLVATLPGNGSTDEVLIVNTHTDGQNAFEENGGIACVELARRAAKRGRSGRDRTLVFSATTGHFSGGGQPQTEGFIEDHPELVKRAAAALTVEHFGAREWLDDAGGYHPSGEIEIGAIFHSQTGIVAPAIESLKAADLRRSELLRPAAVTFFGVGTAFHQKGVPSVAFIAGPNYLLAVQGREGHLDKLDGRRFSREVVWSADLLDRLDKLPAAQLAAGDSAVLRPGVAG